MLTRLEIRNYAIIDNLAIDFHKGFNIITGETGAGKSILMGALGLVLGDRAESSMLFNKEAKCVVEALFQPEEKKQLKQLLLANELDADEQLIVRREIAANGKSRSFINDTPVTLQVLRQFAGQMVDLHRQFDTQDLGEVEFQREVLDALAGNKELVEAYSGSFGRYYTVQTQLKKILAEQANANKEIDYYRFLFNELNDASLKENEIEEAESEISLLSNAEAILDALEAGKQLLNEGDTPAAVQLKMAIQQMQQIKTHPEGFATILERLHAAYIEVKDIAEELDVLGDKVQMNPERMQLLNDRINLGNKLLKKHNVKSTSELLAIQNDLDVKLQQVFGLEEEIERLKKEEAKLLAATLAAGEKLHAVRQKAIAPFEKQMQQLLTQVGMPNALLKVQMQKQSEPMPHGLDEIQFLFDANKSGRFEPLEKVASGGELSRLMLSIKSLVAKSIQMPTLIFDEIDTGISGEAAKQVGIIMQQLAHNHQLIAITHQPQIAAKATAHYFVSKKEKQGHINTAVAQLSRQQRIEAIARMLSGEQLTEASLKIAEEMVGV